MGSQKFINPDNEKQSVEIEECKLDKKLEDFESRNNQIPEVDEFYVAFFCIVCISLIGYAAPSLPVRRFAESISETVMRFLISHMSRLSIRN